MKSFCYICGKYTDKKCENIECLAAIDAMHAEEKCIQRKKLIACLGPICKQRCKYEQDHQLNFLQRWLYSVKAIICVLINRDQSESRGTFEGIGVARTHYAKLYAGWEEEWIQVGRGFFVNWWVSIEKDGEWEM